MIEGILVQDPDARIAVIKFSKDSVIRNLSSFASILSQSIDENTMSSSPDIGGYELEGRNKTALYESINVGISLLENSNTKGKGILSFTKGVSNFQFNPEY